jgi:hypothetical protein
MNTITEKITAQWQDVVNVLLGIWLVVSPWVLAYVDETMAAWNAAVIGVVIALAAMSALVAYEKWEEWITAALAAWLIASPYVLGFGGMQAAAWNHLAVGLLVGILALWRAMTAHGTRGLATKH